MKTIEPNTNYIDLKVEGICHFLGTSRSAFIWPSMASYEVIFTPISPAFNHKARHAEAEVVIGRGTFDLNTIKSKYINCKKIKIINNQVQLLTRLGYTDFFHLVIF